MKTRAGIGGVGERKTETIILGCDLGTRTCAGKDQVASSQLVQNLIVPVDPRRLPPCIVSSVLGAEIPRETQPLERLVDVLQILAANPDGIQIVYAQTKLRPLCLRQPVREDEVEGIAHVEIAGWRGSQPESSNGLHRSWD